MKIILREHVEQLGDRGDEVNVAPGYARNFLLPKGLAYRSGQGSAKQISDQRRAWAVREERSDQAAQELASQLAALDLSVRRRAGDRGTLYGSVTNSDIGALLAAAGHKIERRRIQLKEPIKSLGTFELGIKLHRNVSANVTVVVLTESGQTLAQVEADKATLEPAVQPRTASGEDDADRDDEDDEGMREASGAKQEVRED
jgi:large subunit ribosomal protein L9